MQEIVWTESRAALAEACPAFCGRGFLEIDLDAMESNVEFLASRLPPGARMMAVAKANAYGHGALPLARALEGQDVIYGYATATGAEALALRRGGIKKPILALGYSFPQDMDTLVEAEVSLCLFSQESLAQMEAAAEAVGKKARAHIKVDTGMGRIGCSPGPEGLEFARAALASPWLQVEGIFSHFSKADTDAEYTLAQWRTLQDFARLCGAGPEVFVHGANSAGLLQLPDTAPLLARVGISLYGLSPLEEPVSGLRPVMSFFSRLVQVKQVRAGTPISYGGDFCAPRPMRIGTVPIGYGDGYPRSLSGRGYVLVGGRRAAIVGRICMDHLMIDLTDLPEAEVGSRVVLLGADGQERIDARELAELSGRYYYELLCCMADRMPRLYLGRWANRLL